MMSGAPGPSVLTRRHSYSSDARCCGSLGPYQWPVGALAQAAIGRWQRLDALINNAGVTTFKGGGHWDAMDAEVFQHIMGVNVVGTFQMVRACAPHLQAARGAIVNVSSIAGSLGIGSSVPYIASKGAVNAMTLATAKRLMTVAEAKIQALGAPGGAIAIATANRVLMLEHAIYSVISPEGAATREALPERAAH